MSRFVPHTGTHELYKERNKNAQTSSGNAACGHQKIRQKYHNSFMEKKTKILVLVIITSASFLTRSYQVLIQGCTTFT
jgi:hypothetical protein